MRDPDDRLRPATHKGSRNFLSKWLPTKDRRDAHQASRPICDPGKQEEETQNTERVIDGGQYQRPSHPLFERRLHHFASQTRPVEHENIYSLITIHDLRVLRFPLNL